MGENRGICSVMAPSFQDQEPPENPVRFSGQHVRSDRLLELVERDLLVGTMPDPRVRNVALTALLEALDQLVEAATEQPTDAGPTQIAEQSAYPALRLAWP